MLGEAAVADTFLGERYRRIARRRGKKKAVVAVGRSILEEKRGVKSDVLDRSRWEWMQKYVTWEASGQLIDTITVRVGFVPLTFVAAGVVALALEYALVPLFHQDRGRRARDLSAPRTFS